MPLTSILQLPKKYHHTPLFAVIKPEDVLLLTWELDAKRLARLRHVATAGKIMMLVMTMVVELGVLKGRPRSNETQFLSFIAIRFERNLQAIHVVLPETANVIASSYRFHCRPKPSCGSASDSRCASVGVSK